MADISTRWWGLVVELTRDEACFAAAPRTELMQIFNLIPPPFGQIVALAVGGAKAAMRRAVGDQGLSLHVTWAGIPHWFGTRGNPAPCAEEAFVAPDGGEGAGAALPVLRRVPAQVTILPERADALPNALQPPVDLSGSIFRITGTDCFEPTTVQSQFVLEFTNLSGEWVSVEVERADGSVDKTGRIPHGESGSIDNLIAVYKNGINRISRWRPGFFGLPGSGGGQIQFSVPEAAGMGYIRFNVVG